MLQLSNRAMFNNKKRKSCSAGHLIQIHSLDKSKQSHGIQISHPLFMRKENCKGASARGQRFSQLRAVKRLQKWDVFHPKRSTDRVHAGQTSAVSLVNFSEQMTAVQRDVIESEARSASRAAAGRLTADSRRSSQGFPPTCRQPSAASMQGVCVHWLQPGSVLRLCWIVHESGSVCRCCSCVFWLLVCETTLCPFALV